MRWLSVLISLVVTPMTPVAHTSSMTPGDLPLTALAAILGSLVGALGSSVSAWITQRYHSRRDLLARKVFHREELYSDFISESARLLLDALEHSVLDPKNLIPVYALLSRMRLSSPPAVIAKAEEVVRHILGFYGQPNLTPAQIQAIASKDAGAVDLLKDFSQTCRAELDSVQRQL